MTARPGPLAGLLSRPLSAPLYVLHGDEPLLVIEAADAIRAHARGQGFDETETLVVGHGFRWDELTLAAGNLSLFGGQKLIDLRIPTGKPGREGADALQRYVGALSPGTVTLITLPEMDWAARKTAWFKAVSAVGVTLELNAPERGALPAWLAERLERQRQSAPSEALRFIADHVEGNLLAAHQEILKLGLLHDPGTLTLEQVEQAVLNVARYDMKMLRAALWERDVSRCHRVLEGLRAEGAAPPLVLWTITNEIRALAIASRAREEGQPIAQALKTAAVFDKARGQGIARVLPHFSSAPLRAALLHAARVDRVIKGIADGDVWDELLALCLRATRR